MSVPPLTLPRAEAEAIIAHARAAAPRECCGLLAGQAGGVTRRYPITNTYEGDDFYHMDAAEQYRAEREIDRQGWDLLAIYHSHPVSVAYPSARDIAHALWPGTPDPNYPDTYYIICSLADPAQPVLRAFLIRQGGQLAEAAVIIAD